jgi:hypothetical protein
MLKKLVPAVLGALLMASPVIAVTTASAAPVAKTAKHKVVKHKMAAHHMMKKHHVMKKHWVKKKAPKKAVKKG